MMDKVVEFVGREEHDRFGGHLQWHINTKAHVSEGAEYTVCLDRVHDRPRYLPRYQRWSLRFDFAITEGGDAGLILPKYFNLTSFNAKTGRVLWPDSGDYLCLLRSVPGGPIRADRASPLRLREVPLIATVKDVTRSFNGKALHPDSVYSRIDKLVVKS